MSGASLCSGRGASCAFFALLVHAHLRQSASTTAAGEQRAVVQRLDDPQDDSHVQCWYHPPPLRFLEWRPCRGHGAIQIGPNVGTEVRLKQKLACNFQDESQFLEKRAIRSAGRSLIRAASAVALIKMPLLDQGRLCCGPGQAGVLRFSLVRGHAARGPRGSQGTSRRCCCCCCSNDRLPSKGTCSRCDHPCAHRPAMQVQVCTCGPEA